MGLDPRQAIVDWIAFAQDKGYARVAGQRKFVFDIDLVNTGEEEEHSLFEFCRHLGLNGIARLSDLVVGPLTRQGHEHKVFLPRAGEEPRVTKVTFPGRYGRIEHTPFLYLDRLVLCNELFPDLKIRVEDFVRAEGGYSFIISMNAFTGPHPSLDEIDSFLVGRGFRKLTTASLTVDYTNTEIRIHLRDCHSRNWIKKSKALLIPIDVVPERIV